MPDAGPGAALNAYQLNPDTTGADSPDETRLPLPVIGASPAAESAVNPQNNWAPVADAGLVVSMQATPAVSLGVWTTYTYNLPVLWFRNSPAPTDVAKLIPGLFGSVTVFVPVFQHDEASFWLWHATMSVDAWWETLKSCVLLTASAQPSAPELALNPEDRLPAWTPLPW